MLEVAASIERTVATSRFVIRTFTVEEISSGIVQAYVPGAAGVEAVIRIGVTKLSFEYSTFTLAIDPSRVQVILRVDPTVHASPPTGAVSASEPLTVKAAESAETVASVACFTRILIVLAIASARVHVELAPVGP